MPGNNGPLARDLDTLRREIDALDGEVLDRLSRRARLALAIGEVKRAEGRPVYDPQREADLIARLVEANPGPLPAAAVAAVFRRIVQACRNLEAAPKVAFLGPRGTFSHQAALAAVGPGIEAVALPDIADVAESVARGEVDRGVMPAENSTEGVIGVTFDMLVEHNLVVVGEIILPIHLYLIAGVPAERVAVVYSHPQPLKQARQWLRIHLPKARQVPVSSTADAAERAAREADAAAIVGPMLVDENRQPTLLGPIEDRADNRTRFWIVAREPVKTGRKSSLLLSLPHEPGSLARTLQVFAGAGVNLTSITSRPERAQGWEYRFFIDVEGNAYDEPLRGAVAKLVAAGVHVRTLGVYDSAQEPA